MVANFRLRHRTDSSSQENWLHVRDLFHFMQEIWTGGRSESRRGPYRDTK